ncbi:MAG TPA: glycosyltransferase family 4 protein [Planctomycetota bacterium]|nr:glycosyltransferase family 4 protein [Planctomycetota bacterium]
MNVLFLDHATDLGGAEVSLLGLMRTLDKERFAPTLACPPGTLADRARALGIPVITLGLRKLGGRSRLLALWRLWRGIRALRRVARRGRFDALHANTLRAAIYASGVAPSLGVPLVWHVRDHAVPSWARQRLLQRCEVAVAPSQFIADALGNDPKVRIVPNGIDLADVPVEGAGAAFRRELGIPSDAPVIGCLGRLLPWKGQHFFVGMAARLAPRLPQARFLVVGGALYAAPGTDYPALLKELAARLKVEDKVLFVGHRDDPLAALSAMDVVVNCSQNEPFGRVLIEAMACRRPIAAFRSGAVPEIVEDGATGVLAPFGDTAALAEAVLGLVGDPARAQALGEAGRHRVAARFTLAASTAGIESVYAELAALRQREPHP